MENMELMFEPVLEKNEKILKIYKPNKCKFGWYVFLLSFVSWIWLLAVPVGFLWYDGAWRGFETPFWVALWITLGVLLLVVLITIFCSVLWYKNRFYAYTSKRILVRGGIIGIDYKSLEFKSLTATVVKVSLLDKLVRKNTGTIKFGSPSSPVFSMMGSHSNQYMFNHIEKPYETLKEIKELINTQE
ncbi:MAG: PH domain-containing protein [Firmicutes bacterium]|nr:PH domain-containing protein [Bacillota bacterium]